MHVPTIADPAYFAKAFNTIQQLIVEGQILAGHDVSAGGLVTALLEMCFPTPDIGMSLDLSALGKDPIKVLFSENPALIIQVNEKSNVQQKLDSEGIQFVTLGTITKKEGHGP